MSSIQPVCWVGPDAQEQIAFPGCHVETHPAVKSITPSYENKVEEDGDEGEKRERGEERDDKEGDETGEQQQHQLLPPPPPPPPPPSPPSLPEPSPTPAVDWRAEHEAEEQDALLMAKPFDSGAKSVSVVRKMRRGEKRGGYGGGK